jgi:hypothetical protein
MLSFAHIVRYVFSRAVGWRFLNFFKGKEIFNFFFLGLKRQALLQVLVVSWLVRLANVLDCA